MEFCNKKSKKEGLTPCYTIDKRKKDPNNKNDNDDLKWIVKCNFSAIGYRLPTEAEWEYAARGGVKTQNSASHKYAGSNNINKVAWYEKNSNGKTHPVGQKQPNELGIYDMSGNVREWCWDWYNENYYKNSPMDNPKGPKSGAVSVLRGGSWNIEIWGDGRVAERSADPRIVRYYNNGFRLVRTQ